MGIGVRNASMLSGADGFVENIFTVVGPDLGPVPQNKWDTLKSRLKVRRCRLTSG